MILNVVFHRVVSSPGEMRHIFEMTHDVFLEQLETIREWVTGRSDVHDYRFYVDDGDDSFTQYVLPAIDKTELSNITLAVTSGDVGKKGMLGWSQLLALNKLGIHIASHSVDHPALAFYQDGQPLCTPSGGRYESSLPGHHWVLADQQVLYQLIESHRQLATHDLATREFVLPHGCYNQTTLSLVQASGLYDVVSTTDPWLDVGDWIRPRVLTRGDETVPELLCRLDHLIPATSL